ncbi:MAG: DUF6356 family protein [Pseudomonadota bacterium]
MISALKTAFTAHPATVDETYLEHSRFAFRFSAKLLCAGAAAFVHALLPFAFQHTAGDIIRQLHQDIAGRS